MRPSRSGGRRSNFLAAPFLLFLHKEAIVTRGRFAAEEKKSQRKNDPQLKERQQWKMPKVITFERALKCSSRRLEDDCSKME